jgi:6,7-dimethyl-8-ribityllumazine synthase
MATRENDKKAVTIPALDSHTTHHAGALEAADLHVAVIVAQFHGDITTMLLHGALETLHERGINPANLTIVEVPGAWELPVAANRLAQSKRWDAILALGVVIRGDTPHFDFVCAEASRGLMDVALRHDCVVTFGVLTTDTEKQALARAGGEHGNKGAETAEAAMQMANLFKKKL